MHANEREMLNPEALELRVEFMEFVPTKSRKLHRRRANALRIDERATEVTLAERAGGKSDWSHLEDPVRQCEFLQCVRHEDLIKRNLELVAKLSDRLVKLVVVRVCLLQRFKVRSLFRVVD